MSTKQVENKVSELIAENLSSMGYELVRVQVMSGGRYMTLQVMAERLDEKPMTVSDCVRISHEVSPLIEADKEMADRYTLEVSSPGVDRPLVRMKDFERFTGHVARIEMEAPMEIDGGKQKRFQGKIVRVNGSEADAELELRTETGAVRLPMQRIARAKLVTTEQKMPGSQDGAKH